MKSKLTLRLDDGLKERAKQLAEERGASVSKIVEDYFRLLLHAPSGGDSRAESASGKNAVPDDLRLALDRWSTLSVRRRRTLTLMRIRRPGSTRCTRNTSSPNAPRLRYLTGLEYCGCAKAHSESTSSLRSGRSKPSGFIRGI